jgi:hypothetical protein
MTPRIDAMKIRFVSAALLLYAAHAVADSPAVRDWNNQLGYASGDTYVAGGTDSNTYGINAATTVPLAAYVAGSLSGAFNRTNVATSDVATATGGTVPSCSLNDGSLVAGLFVRRSDIGRLGLSYGLGRTRSRCDATFLATGSDRLDTRTTALNAEVYLGPFTVGGTRSRTKVKSAYDFDSDSLAGSWYPMENLRMTVSGDGLDLKDTYHFNLEYQPELLENSTGLLIGYTTRRGDNSTRAVTVGINYYFGTRVDLKTRDREYR